MAETVDLASGIRSLIRDFPQFFEVEEGPLQVLTVRLPHPLISAASLQVYVTPDTDPTTPVLTSAWQLDERNGILKMTDASYIGQRLLIAGYHYVWFSDADVARATAQITSEVLYTTPNKSLSDFSGGELEVVQLGAVTHLLWSLCIELALDIDVSTPEGMFIPAHQRYAQVWQMMQYWENEYQSRAASLNIGYGALEIFQLRRVAYTTGRYVPVYVSREIDDPRWPKRVYPPIPDLTMNPTDDTIEVLDGVEIADPAARRSSTGGYYPSVGPGFLGTP